MYKEKITAFLLLSFMLMVVGVFGQINISNNNYSVLNKDITKDDVSTLADIKNTKSSPTLSISNITAAAGSTVLLPVTTTGISGMASFQFTIEYDPAELTFNGTTSGWPAGVSGVTVQEPTAGHITFVWAAATGLDVSAGVFFNISFDIASGATGTKVIQWSDDPTVKDISDQAFSQILSSWIDGSITITGTLSPSVTIDDVTASPSSSVTVPVNATDLQDLAAFQWTITYDATKLTYVSCSNWATGITAANVLIDNSVAGTLTFVYNDYPNSVDITSGKFFDINFTSSATASGTALVEWSDTPTLRELSNTVPDEIVAVWNDGSVTFTSTLNPTMTINDEYAAPASTVAVPVYASDIVDLAGFQWTIIYDDTKLTYVDCANWAPSINTSNLVIDNSVSGIITFAFNDYPNSSNFSNDLMFEINFATDAAASGIALVQWSDTPTLRELSNTIPTEIIANWIDGSVIFSPTIEIDTVYGSAGSPVTVPVYALNFTTSLDLISFQWTINYDQTRLDYVDCSDWDADVVSSNLVINADETNGILTFAYNNYGGSPIEIIDGLFFNINFNVLTGVTGDAPVVWSDTPTPRELANSDPTEITVEWIDGAVILGIGWNGSQSTDWQDALNWTPNIVPSYDRDAIIPDVSSTTNRYPIIDDGTLTAECNNLQIDLGAYVTIAPNGQMTVYGDVANAQGVDGLVVQSDSTGDGSLIENTLGVNATVERFLPTAGSSEWHFISSAINATPTSLLATYSFDYDETQDDWWTGPDYYYNTTSGWSDKPANMVNAEGYITYEAQSVKSFQGVLNADAQYSKAVTYTIHSGNAANGDPYTAFDGWVLLGNPYPCALNWELLDKTDDITSTVYYYDDDIDNYAYYQDGGSALNGGTQYIPSGQAFFVKTTDLVDGGNLLILKSARVHNDQLLWKGDVSTGSLKLKVKSGVYYDETLIKFNEMANDSFDDKYDAYKHFSWNYNVPQIYTLNDSKTIKLAINSFSNEQFRKVIPLGYKFVVAGEQSLSVEENSMNNTFVIIHDLYSESYQLINQGDVYTFDVSSELTNDKLELILENNVAPQIDYALENKEVYVGEEYVFELASDFYSDVNTFDVLTMKITAEDGTALPDWIQYSAEKSTFTVNAQSEGSYVVKVTIKDMFGEVTSTTFDIISKSATPLSEYVDDVISLYPTPTDDKVFLTVGGAKKTYNVTLTSASGATVYNCDLNNESVNTIEMSNLSSGLYMLTIKFEDNSTVVRKVVKK